MNKETNVESLNVSLAIAKPMLPAVYWLVAWLGCCFILGSMFYMNIQHQKRIDKIFDDYYKNMSVLNGK